MKILLSLLKKTKSSSFIGFICASGVYIFGGSLIFGFSNQNPSNLKLEGNHSLTLKLASIDNGGDSTRFSKEPSKPKPIKKKLLPQKPLKEKPKPLAQTKPKQQTEPESIETSQTPQPSSNLTQEGGETQTLVYNEGLSDDFLSKIHSAISANNPYPRMARLRHMQGEVILEFILDINGRLEGVKILSSTAGDLLNKSAIKAVEQAAKDFPLPTKKVRIKVPVIYNLKG